MKKFYITTPIYYVNDVPHIGHCYTTIAADIMARWKRLAGYDVYFITGTDEHGAKMVQAAKEKHKTPAELVDEMSGKFREAWKLLNITNTDFVRTTEERHKKSVDKIVELLNKNGFIYKSKYEGLYCVGCEKYLSAKDLDENGNCPYHKTKPISESEENYFFKLSEFKDKILARILDANHKEHIQIFPSERRNEIIGKLKLGLDDISISRSTLDWGIPLPFDKSQTIYVWVDALISYLTGTGFDKTDGEFENVWPCDIHLMAKDILWFHAVIWPAILMASGLPVARAVYSHGFFTIDGNKMSKSLGNVISPIDLTQKFGVDPARYLMATVIPFGPDGDISWPALISKYNTDLANNIGNLQARIFKLYSNSFNCVIADCDKDLSLALRSSEILKKEFEPEMDGLLLHRASDALQKAVTMINQQIETDAPWALAKKDLNALSKCLWSYTQALDLIALHLLPFMPDVSNTIWHANGAEGDVEAAAKKYFADGKIPAEGFSKIGSKLNNAGIMFPRIKQ